MTAQAPAPDPAVVEDATVTVDGVSKWFGQKVAVSGITCSFGPGLTGLLGPNGAGKTTLLRMLTGLIRPSEGSISVLDTDLRTHPAAYRDVGLVPEEDAVYGFLTAREYVAYAARLIGLDRPGDAAAHAIDSVDLTPDADRDLAGFSKGMRQRAKVAAALVGEPKVLVLDEPLNGTDPVQRAHLISLFGELAARGHTVVVSSHVLQEVERMTDRVIAMVDGKLAAAGDILAIRQAMSDIPFRVLVESDAPRKLAAALMGEDLIHSVTVADRVIHVETADLSALGTQMPSLARQLGVRVTAFKPEDESLESVFRYLVRRR